jgi:hypothetical protein
LTSHERSRPRFLTVVVVAAFADDTHALPVDARLDLYATCDGGDVVGTHLCFAVKEGIITSVGLQLVDDRTARTGIAVHLVSVDASPPGLPKGATSAVGVTYAFFGGPIGYYDGAQVFLVGAKKVSDINNLCRKSRRPNSKTEGSNSVPTVRIHSAPPPSPQIEFRRLDSTALFDPLGKPLEHVPALLRQSVRIGEAVVR